MSIILKGKMFQLKKSLFQLEKYLLEISICVIFQFVLSKFLLEKY